MILRNVKMTIRYYKQPHKIIKVDYKKAVKEVWDTHISDDKTEDKMAKKTIANINIGLLEKSNNKRQNSKIFNSLREACYYQSLYGGKVYSISHKEIQISKDEDGTNECRESDDKYYILSICDEATLTNGFRYIKELLLQHHNFTMFMTYETLKNAGVRVCSVKSDAFTIWSDDVHKVEGFNFLQKYVKGCLDVGSEIGQWKAEADKKVIYPKDEYKYKYNTLTKIPLMKNETISIDDEWDTRSICEKILKVNAPVIIKAKYAGSGKSYIMLYRRILRTNE